ncbi:acylphosphatase [Candidatus Woesearchaeota archaeon]|nr:acylphosphatase [Candidatus Woesearchaeota archaeon]
MKAIKIIIKGKVQGVGFRQFVKEKAEHLKVHGYVKNLENGDVEVVAEADNEDILSAFVEMIRPGPPKAEVAEVVTDAVEHKGYKEFGTE